jgi:hypothetical protein
MYQQLQFLFRLFSYFFVPFMIGTRHHKIMIVVDVDTLVHMAIKF